MHPSHDRRPLTRRVRAAEPFRMIRIGSESWRACVAAVNVAPEAPLAGKVYVCFHGPEGKHHWLVMAIGEFEQSSRYRLRCLALRLRDEDSATTDANAESNERF